MFFLLFGLTWVGSLAQICSLNVEVFRGCSEVGNMLNNNTFVQVLKDVRVLVMIFQYSACFGILDKLFGIGVKGKGKSGLQIKDG